MPAPSIHLSFISFYTECIQTQRHIHVRRQNHFTMSFLFCRSMHCNSCQEKVNSGLIEKAVGGGRLNIPDKNTKVLFYHMAIVSSLLSSGFFTLFYSLCYPTFRSFSDRARLLWQFSVAELEVCHQLT